ncbi:signal recognition particle-docking protein FtsY [Buchnera aphidicola (Mollitrichosiphum nigrofasciatum)]|uniref:signal recognition particle-docking protein FtsY n=1 Tax=Buchnera aphidicola TaxID=9 RepID=UPI0031B83915
MNKKKSFFDWLFKKKKKKSLDIKKQSIKKKKNLYSKLNNITNNIFKKIKHFFSNNNLDKNFFKKLEEELILSDFGVKFSKKIINKVRVQVNSQCITEVDNAYLIFQNILKKILSKSPPYENNINNKPHIILIVGSNGVGKTSAIGKLTKKYINSGHSVVLAAGDTFRPGAVDQLKKWGKINSVPVISQLLGADSASVIYDTIQSAKAKKIDVVIADTAGRLHNKISLMQELKKIVSVIKKIDKNAPHEILLVLDATNGQNSILQTKTFNKYLNINGIILTKLDGTAKGGVIFYIIQKFSIPINYISVGENIDDFYSFKNKNYLDNFFFKK